jgi:T-complex protein 1 subunit gamma
MQAPVVVMNTNSGERQTGRKAQLSNIAAAKTYAIVPFLLESRARS